LPKPEAPVTQVHLATPVREPLEGDTREYRLLLGIAAGALLIGALVTAGITVAIAVPEAAAIVFVAIATLLGFLVVAALIGGLIAAAIWISNIGSHCPECGKSWAKVLVREKITEQKKCYGLVTRSSYSSSSGWISGTSSYSGSCHHTSHGGTVHSSGSTSWQERVPIIRTTYMRYYQCKFCEASWTEEEEVEDEDFDIERE
jgi:hypothetical protein